MSNNLPNGWEAAPLKDLIVPRNDRISPQSMPNAPFIGMEHVEPHTNQILETVPASTMTSNAARFYKGDVLYGRMRPYLNKVVSPSFDGLASAEFIVFPESEAISSRFLLRRLSSNDFTQFACSQYEGDRPRVKFDQLGTFDVLVPPTPEQTRIIEKLEELLSDLDAGIAELKAAQRKLAQYRQSRLKAAVEDASYSSTAPSVPLGNLVVSTGQGWSPKCEGNATDDGWAVIKTTAIQPLNFDGSHNKKLPGNLKPRENLELTSGDLLVTRAGPRSRVGITCLVRQVREKLILCDKAYRIRCDESQINPAFLELVLNAPSFVNRIDSLKTGINDSGLNLTQDRFLTLLIPLPSLDDQVQIIEALASQNQLITDQEDAVARGLEQAAAQRKNILKAAFSGQLVPQDPNDEPASTLLARIRAQREASADTPARKRGRKARGAV